MTRPRAADDFLVIRVRLAELRRERARVVRGEGEPGPKPYRRPLDNRSTEIDDSEHFQPFRGRSTS
jgi:hypothetical protein